MDCEGGPRPGWGWGGRRGRLGQAPSWLGWGVQRAAAPPRHACCALAAPDLRPILRPVPQLALPPPPSVAVHHTAPPHARYHTPSCPSAAMPRPSSLLSLPCPAQPLLPHAPPLARLSSPANPTPPHHQPPSTPPLLPCPCPLPTAPVPGVGAGPVPAGLCDPGLAHLLPHGVRHHKERSGGAAGQPR